MFELDHMMQRMTGRDDAAINREARSTSRSQLPDPRETISMRWPCGAATTWPITSALLDPMLGKPTASSFAWTKALDQMFPFQSRAALKASARSIGSRVVVCLR
jgi:hypothetical protein